MSDSKKIFTQIPKVMADVGAVGKGGFNQHDNYKFRTIDDVYNKLQPALSLNGVFFVPNILDSREEKLKSAKGTDMLRVKLKVRYDIYADDGSKIESVVEGEAIDRSDKATNKALTAALKYMLIQVFCLAVENESDADSQTPEFKAPPKKAVMNQAPSQNVENVLPSDYVAKFGKFKGQKISDVDMYDLSSYVAFIEKSATEQKKSIKGDVAEFMNKAVSYLNSKSPKEEMLPF